ncbi:MAG: hypothetical protein HFE63_10790, partial [Clostridiales bacterium]|nr:hypothetical protein [Clostridiales bacterium]
AEFIDLDEEIVKRYGEVKEIFATRGESGFREIELEVLRSVLDSADSDHQILLSCGGGVPTYTPSRELLAARTLVIWLRRGLDSIGADSVILSRPPINGSIETYKRLMNERYPIYRSIADYSFYNSFPQRTAVAIVKKVRNCK